MDTGLFVALIVVGITIFYWVISGILLRCSGSRFAAPNKERLSAKIMASRLIAHRGSKLENIPENTIMAFKRAIEVGVDVIELDVWLTADKEVVVFHDGTFKRMCGGKEGHVNDTNLADLPSLVGVTPEVTQNVTKLGAQHDAYRIPTFDEVLSLVPASMGILVEFKTDNDVDLLIEKTVALLEKHNRTTAGNTVVFSLKMRINKKLQAVQQSMPTICSVEEFLLTYIYYYTGLLPFMKLNYNIFGCTSDRIDAHYIKEELDILPMWACRLLNVFVGGKPSKAFVAPKLVDHMAKRGCPCWLLGVNEQIDIDVVPRLHASGMLTDRPGWLKEKVVGGQVSGIGVEDVKLLV
jgi:glycerophosphoryl diester phosphodiesterase